MKRSVAYHLLRLGLAVTFIWIGIFIVRNPAGWSGFIKPWARELLPADPVSFTRAAGFFDITLGAFLGLGIWVRLASVFAAIHLAGILVASGVDATTVRDIGLLGGALTLVFWPSRSRRWRRRKSEPEEENEDEP